MMYNRDPVSLLKLAENQRDGNPVSLGIYKSTFTKAHSNIKKLQVTPKIYCNMRTFNNPFSIGDKILRRTCLMNHIRQR